MSSSNTPHAKSCYLKSGDRWRITSDRAMDIHDILPGGNYVIKTDMEGNMFLQTIDSFSFEGKRYGDLNKNRERITNTFLARDNSTGVVLAGEKGSGKSLLAKTICIDAATDHKIPTIVVNTPFHGDKFNSFLQAIQQPAIVLFDEFEKVYDSQQQESILTLLDGVFPSKKLFIITCNDKWRIDTNMRNRPGRVFYMIDFKGLSPEFIAEYCKDKLKNQTLIGKVCDVAGLFTSFNFDMLKALIEEMNRYGEEPEVALKILNVKPEYDNNEIDYTVEVVNNGQPIEIEHLYTRSWTGLPLNQSVYVEWYEEIEPEEENESQPDAPYTSPKEEVAALIRTTLRRKSDTKQYDVTFEPGDIKKIDTKNGRYYYSKDGINCVLTKVVKNTRSSYYSCLA